MSDTETKHEKGGERRRRIITPKRILAVGAAIVALGLAAHESYDRSGEITSYDPIKKGSHLVDNKLNILNWNMHNETSEKYKEIKAIVREENIDVVALQEVSANDAKGLSKYFPGAYIKFAMADAKSKLIDGGYGNVLMTFQEQKDVEAASIDGNFVGEAAISATTGFVADASELAQGQSHSFRHMKDATQEDRSALASTIQVQQRDGLADVRIMTGHVGSPDDELHEEQYDKLRDFVRVNAEESEAAVFCGDINLGPERVIPSLLRIGFYAHQTARTTLSGVNTDYCAYYPGSTFGSGEVTVLGNHTDHFALVGSWKTTP